MWNYKIIFMKTNIDILGSNSPREHCLYVWDNFVRKSNAQFIVAVAHSAGIYF